METQPQVTRRCTKCILPDTYPGIHFDDEGVCNFCRNHQPARQRAGKEKLQELLRSRPRTGQYDCVVPISGGKDSTFILYYIVKELGLRTIAMSYDSGFQTDTARENVRSACQRLGVPLKVVTPPGQSQLRLLKEWIQLSEKVGFLYGPCGGNCEAILRTQAIAMARAHGAPFVIWGSSALESSNAGDYDRFRRMGKEGIVTVIIGRIRVIARKLKSQVKSPRQMLSTLFRIFYILIGYHSLKFRVLSIYQRLKMGFPLRTALRPGFTPPFTGEDPEFVHFFDYITWDSINNVGLLERELNWKHPPGHDARFDCSIHCLGNLEYMRKRGISADGVTFCCQIREGRLDRAGALKREETVAKSAETDRQDVLERVGLK